MGRIRIFLTAALLFAGCFATGAQHRGRYETRPPKNWLELPREFLKITPPEDTVTIFALGDIMAHGAVTKSALQHGYSTFFKYIEDKIQGADVAIGNMEFPLAGKPYSGYPAFSGPDEYAQYLWDIGMDVLLTSNNHILDKGTPGLRRTIEQLDSRGIMYTGIAETPQRDSLLNPLILNVRGLRIAIVNFTYGTNLGASTSWPRVQYMNPQSLEPVMKRAREKADVIIVFPHWGIEYDKKHSADQEVWARWLIAKGADAIIGHHPHVVQDTQVIEGVPIVYSLGNALSNQNDLPARLEACATLRIVCRWGEPPAVLAPQLEFLWCTKPGMVEDSYSAVPVTLPKENWRDQNDYQRMQNTLEQF